MGTYTHTFTFAVDGAWQPVGPASPTRRKNGDTADFFAGLRRFVVRNHMKGCTPTDFHGAWETAGEARRFGSSLSCIDPERFGGPDNVREWCEVVEVAPYWYAPAWGHVRPGDALSGPHDEADEHATVAVPYETMSELVHGKAA